MLKEPWFVWAARKRFRRRPVAGDDVVKRSDSLVKMDIPKKVDDNDAVDADDVVEQSKNPTSFGQFAVKTFSSLFKAVGRVLSGLIQTTKHKVK